MIAGFLRGKYLWERGDTRGALACLREITPVVVPDDVIAERAGGSWETFVAGVVSDDGHRLDPFPDAMTALWRAFPGQHLLAALEVRAVCGDPLTGADLAWLDEAAAEGILSTDPADHDHIARIVLLAINHPNVAAAAGGERLEDAILQANRAGAAAAFVRSRPDLIASRFLYLVFHAARIMDRGMVIDRIERALRRHPALIDDLAATLGRGDPTEIARVGMRRDSPSCAGSLVAALRTRDPAALAPDCAPPP